MAAAKIHVSLNVADVERSTRFYEAFFGVAAHKRRPGYANFDLENPDLKLALNQHPASQTEQGPLNHLGIQVATIPDVNAARERLIASGLATFDEGDTTCCYAVQNKIWAHDPDGNAWEVYALVDDLPDDTSGEQAGKNQLRTIPLAASACCGGGGNTVENPNKSCCG